VRGRYDSKNGTYLYLNSKDKLCVMIGYWRPEAGGHQVICTSATICSSRVFMRLVFAVLICTVLARAQQQKPLPSQEAEAIAQLQGLADRVKSALASGNLAAANRLATELGSAISRHERALTLAQLEAALPADGLDRFYTLARVANAAFDAADYARAETYANELLALAPQYREDRSYHDRSYGEAIFYGNMVLGRVALRRDYDIPKAKAALIASGQTPGSPTLNSFGPDMSLAKDLLEAGERDSVLQFFDQCRAFWKTRVLERKLDDWIAVVKGCCRLPDFGNNLGNVP
jgi:tetratricopeptide (TPR) repeat protein